MTKIWIASDHAGFELKKQIVHRLGMIAVEHRYEIHDLGTDSTKPVDYPDFANEVCQRLHPWTLIDAKHNHLTEAGILICGSGQGMAMRANKFEKIRAALCCNVEMAKLAREHNDANVLCLGARKNSIQDAIQIVDAFLSTPFAGGRHQARVAKVSSSVG